jgi:hypothetical protein
MNLFTKQDWQALSALFVAGYPGYRPTVREIPNGDGKVDVEKRFLHVALKYDPPEFARQYLARAHYEACRIAEALQVPDYLYPRVENSTLRVLDYPPGAGSAEHTDFDLFTVHCFRSHRDDFVRTGSVDPRAEAIDPDVHLGELAEVAGIGKPTPHYVPGRSYEQQAIVYFAMPANSAKLPTGETVGVWLAERISRSRVYK